MKKPIYTKYYETLKIMPPLSMWPDRSNPYSDEANQVLQWIKSSCNVSLVKAMQIKDSAKYAKAIVFDPESKLWTGNQSQSVLQKTQTSV